MEVVQSACNKKAPLDYGSHPSYDIFPPPRKGDRLSYGQRLRTELPRLTTAALNGQTEEVRMVNIYWSQHHAFYPMPNSKSLDQASYAFRYPNRWRDLADKAAQHLSPYIAVQ